MSPAAAALVATQVAVLLLTLASAALAVRTALQSRHDQRRAMLAGLGAIVLLVNAAIVGIDAIAASPGSGWLALVRLVPQAALPLVILLQLRSLHRRDGQARAAARDAPFNHATGLPNHPLLLRQIIPALARCRRDAAPAMFLVASIDGLDDLRAHRGPGQAAEMLRSLAGSIGDTTRAGDLSGHVEPDVLGTLLPAATEEAAERVAARLRALSSERMIDPEMSGQRMTISVGVAMVGDGAEPAALEEAISSALTALRGAMADGGDRIRLAPTPPGRQAGVSA
ncbi:diguanylate cyclase [Roseomonas sp. CAU 1739]|uniref:GGDEF domain-containing protein n=1 Tax=Roseomonas sp. CAU 1739 TaxID=3140364 RepID=UPI00325C310B